MLIFCVSSLHAQYYKDYTADQKKKLAESYYLVGKQFQTLGKSYYNTYIKIAYMIYPELNPDEIQEEPDTKVIITDTLAREQEYQNIVKLIIYRFKLLATYFLSKDIANITNYMDSIIYIGDSDFFVSREEVAAGLKDLYKDFTTTGLTIDVLFDFNTINIAATDASFEKNSGADNSLFTLTVKTKSSALDAYFPFWIEEQQYFWHKDAAGNWVIFAINSLPAAADFSSYKEQVIAKNSITENFKACLNAFIKEDLPGVSQYLSDTIEVIPLNISIAKNEIEYTFSGYFDEAELLDIDNSDNLIDSITVNYNPEYALKYAGQVYLLEIGINPQYIPQVSFWAAYKKYYFIKSESGWQIRAIG